MERVIHLAANRNPQWQTALAHFAQRLHGGLFGDGKRELIRRGDDGDRAERDGLPKRSLTAQGQSERAGGIDHRYLDLAARDLSNRCWAVAAEKSDRPAVAALLAQVDARLSVAPLGLIYHFGGDLEHQSRPYGISADYTILRFGRICQTVLLVRLQLKCSGFKKEPGFPRSRE